MAKRQPKRKYPPEIQPLMYCLRCTSLYMRPSLREERRPSRKAGGCDEVVWVCPVGHEIVRLRPVTE
jgi:hypothetical protein